MDQANLIAGLIGVLIGACATLYACWMTVLSERRARTLQHFLRQNLDKDYIRLREELGQIRRRIELSSPSEIDALLNPDLLWVPSDPKLEPIGQNGNSAFPLPSERYISPANVMRSVLNEYELIALGIRDAVFDEALAKRFMRGLLIRDWMSFRVFVFSLRSKYSQPGLYEQLEFLALRWIRRPNRPDSAWRRLWMGYF